MRKPSAAVKLVTKALQCRKIRTLGRSEPLKSRLLPSPMDTCSSKGATSQERTGDILGGNKISDRTGSDW
ncbi:hypothetical protein EVAR_23696_1 [Eumeta japonica]|uniref:Uncharacterized protein n=1 Tax=Eumeta variegata TaxID=151549 RepID=A0A4C1VIS3_EUMVA|nr:hypothetical protein EVAR_23696_1 [Eumeta japonica]